MREFLSGVPDALWVFLGVAVTALGAWLNGRRSSASQKVEADSSAATAAASEWRTLYTEMRAELADMKSRFTAMEGRMGDMEEREDRYREDLAAVYEWVESGPPYESPAPVRPDYLKGLS